MRTLPVVSRTVTCCRDAATNSRLISSVPLTAWLTSFAASSDIASGSGTLTAVTGAALGAALGIVAVVVRQELVLLIMGGVFVMETISVMLQVASFKLTGRRIFRMAPLHHHFELKGWPEPRVIVRFWIVTVILVLIGLASLKIR